MADQSDLQMYNPYGGGQDYGYGDRPAPNAVTYAQAVQAQPQNWQGQAWNEIYPAQEVAPHGGDYGDTSMGQLQNQAAATNRQTDAIAKWGAWQNSPYKNRFPDAPDPATAMAMRDKIVTPPDLSRLTYMPGAAPDTLLDSRSGDLFHYETGGRVRYAGNVTLPQTDELTRGSAAVVAGLRERGLLGNPTPHPLKSDHSWKSSTASEVPGEDVVSAINRNAPTLDDIGKYLSNQSGTAWAQIDRGPRRAMALGTVLTLPLAGAASGIFAPAEIGGLGLAGGGLGGAAASIGAGAAAGGLGMLGGQLAGERGDLSKVDWGAIAKSILASGAGSAVGQGVGALSSSLGASGEVARGIGAAASKVTSEGVGSLFPSPPVNITAYQPYPGMSPEGARRAMGVAGY